MCVSLHEIAWRPPGDAYMVLLELMRRDVAVWERKQRPTQICYPHRHTHPHMGRATYTSTPQNGQFGTWYLCVLLNGAVLG